MHPLLFIRATTKGGIMRYQLYRPAVHTIASQFAQIYKIPKDERNAKMVQQAVVYYINQQEENGVHWITSPVVAELSEYMPLCRTYFPIDTNLLSLLNKAKMDVSIKDVNLSLFPKCFSVAWPEGANYQPMMVNIDTITGHMDALYRFTTEYLGVDGHSLFGDKRDEILTIKVYSDVSSSTSKLAGCFVLPEQHIDGVLKSDEYYNGILGEAANNSKKMGLALPTNNQNIERVITLRMIMRLMVYMSACPDSIKDGFPDDKIYDGGTKYYHPSPMTIGLPDHCKRTHASPEMHWRQWHFRTYPTQPDGSKRPGLVFVNAAVVMGVVDPKTVVEV